ncbi:hypothetical protein PUN28_008126 [Cardiocondyla obscurior]|uniref:Uncharacterized protein n=1 Tax=Cardiocondyla obscurior TaxID=286306 RepID=A0AAW2G161_9HYME
MYRAGRFEISSQIEPPDIICNRWLLSRNFERSSARYRVYVSLFKLST